jgi:hypothetical protein
MDGRKLFVPPLRVLKLATERIRGMESAPRYRVRRISMHKGRLRVDIDWIRLREARLELATEGGRRDARCFFELSPQVIYGRETEFCVCRIDCSLATALWGFEASEAPMRAVLWLTGIRGGELRAPFRRRVASIRLSPRNLAPQSRFPAVSGLGLALALFGLFLGFLRGVQGLL